jgi:hypothetical protein
MGEPGARSRDAQRRRCSLWVSGVPPKKNAGSTRGPTLQIPCLMPFLSAPLERIDKFRRFPPLDSPQKEQETARNNRRAIPPISIDAAKKARDFVKNFLFLSSAANTAPSEGLRD